jgi:hypothetical protein
MEACLPVPASLAHTAASRSRPLPTYLHPTSEDAEQRCQIKDMPDSDSGSRPKRNRTVVSTYNLKILNDNAHHTHLHASNRQTRESTDQPRQRPTGKDVDSFNDAAPQQLHPQSFSSSLTFLTGSSRISPVTDAHLSDTPPDTVSKSHFAKNDMTQYECFNKLTSTRGHYYSAPVLQACGVWVGYLAPDKHKKQYFGMASFNDLKTNFTNMVLPFPPINEAPSASNRNAVCRGCFGQQSALLTLREVHFVHNRVSLKLCLVS